MNNNLAYKEDFWEEIINGQPVLMSPRPTTNHNRVSGNIYFQFKKHLKGRPCEPFDDGMEVYLDEKNRFIPDMMVVCDPEKIHQNGVYGAPDLVVEVLSPSTMKRDKGDKKTAYEQAGVKEYWIVSTEEKSIEQYLLIDGRFVLHEVYAVYPDYLLEKMTDEEKAEIITEFKCSLYDDLLIKLEDVFERVN